MYVDGKNLARNGHKKAGASLGFEPSQAKFRNPPGIPKFFANTNFNRS